MEHGTAVEQADVNRWRRHFLKVAAGGVSATLLGIFARRGKGVAPARLRPPGGISDTAFLAACIRCHQCVTACPRHCLVPGGDGTPWISLGTPHIEARVNPCDLCAGHPQMECIAACPTAALQTLAARTDVRMGLAVVDPQTCLPFLGVSCKACWHACPFPQDAIEFDPSGRPRVIAAGCVGCGLCEHACLAEEAAIRVEPFGHAVAHS